MTPTKYRMDRVIVLHNSKAYVTQLSKEKSVCIGWVFISIYDIQKFAGEPENLSTLKEMKVCVFLN